MITWDISPDIFELGPFTIRWYGLLFASSFVVGLKIMQDIFTKEGKSDKDLNDLFWYMILSTIIGARLGHCLFYNPAYYLQHPLEILMTWKGGLASHGAAMGIIAGLYLYSRKKADQSFLWIMDKVVITVALAAVFIRTGNLMNSEIIGAPTDVPWAFLFPRAESNPVPRHPSQIYEILAYLATFIATFRIYKTKAWNLPDGLIFGVFLVMIFGFRIIVEFYKRNQTYFEEGMALNMGQILSIPLVIFGIYLIYKAYKKGKNGKKVYTKLDRKA